MVSVCDARRGDQVYQPQGISGSESISVSVSTDVEPIEIVPETKFSSNELKELAMKWGAMIGETGALIENRIDMSRKDYLKYTKNLTQEQLLSDPLLYILFRSEEQPEVNFFAWLDKFPKAKNESK